MSALTEAFQVRIPLDEDEHRIGLWSPSRTDRPRTKWTNSARGLAYTLATRELGALRGYMLSADGRWYRGDRQIRAWADEHLPEALRLAADVVARYREATTSMEELRPPPEPPLLPLERPPDIPAEALRFYLTDPEGDDWATLANLDPDEARELAKLAIRRLRDCQTAHAAADRLTPTIR